MKNSDFKYLNSRISIPLYELLKSHRLFAAKWQAIEPARFFLDMVANRMYLHDNTKAEIYSTYIMNIFKPYTGGEYKQYLDALEELKLLIIDHAYMPKEEDPHGIGECKKYLVTELGIELVSHIKQEYLKLLHTDKKTIRRNDKSISKRKVMKTTYADYLKNYIFDLEKNLSFNEERANELRRITDNAYRRNHIEDVLIKIQTKEYAEPRYNECDNRIINDYTLMCSDVRGIVKYKSMVNSAVVDIRACHPTFFSSYIYYNVFLPSSLPSLPSPYLLRYVTDKGDNVPLLGNKISQYSNICENSDKQIESKLKLEHSKWVNMWVDPSFDVRERLAKEWNWEKATVKQAFNETLNGSKKYPRVLKWIAEHFPVLFKLWQSTDVKVTGPMISKHYEQVLMQDNQLYKYATDMGLKLGYENDGFAVFSVPNNESLQRQIDFLVKFIQFLSKEKWGFAPVITVK